MDDEHYMHREIIGSLYEATDSLIDPLVELLNECNMAWESNRNPNELIVSDCRKLTLPLHRMTEQVRELTIDLRANAVDPDADEADEHNMVASPDETVDPSSALPVSEVAVECNMDAPDETVDPSSASPVSEVAVKRNMAAPDQTVEHNTAALHPGSASPVDPNKTA